jgi:hypothetical protein
VMSADDEGSKHFWNVTQLRDYTAQYHRILSSSQSASLIIGNYDES